MLGRVVFEGSYRDWASAVGLATGRASGPHVSGDHSTGIVGVMGGRWEEGSVVTTPAKGCHLNSSLN